MLSSLSVTTRAYLLLAASVSFLLLHVVTLGVIKWMPVSDTEWIRVLQQDEYYSLLLPLLLPVGLAFVYLNWLGMKLYRHN
jgi:hypothetical protein